MNALSALALIVPLDRGGASVDIEALDSDTSEQLAALTPSYVAPLSELKAHLSKLPPARLALLEAAANFSVLLRPALGFTAEGHQALLAPATASPLGAAR